VLRAGTILIAVLAAPAAEPVAILVPDGVLVAVPALGATVSVAGRSGQMHGSWSVTTLPRRGGTAAILRGGRAAGAVTLPGAAPATARIALAGRWNWPDHAGVARVEQTLGAPLDAVAVVGDPGERLGLGGWEHRIPLLPVGVPGRDGPLASAAAASRGMLAWGPVGFPLAAQAVQIPERALRTDAPWRVPVLAGTPWNPGSRSTAQDPAVLRLLVIAAQAAGAPMLVAAGDGCGLLSHPLGDFVERDRPPRLGAVAGGLRYLVVDGGGDGPDHLDPLAATVWERPLVTVLTAGTAALVATAIDPGDGSTAWSVAWTVDPLGPPTGTGPGTGNPDVLARVWRAGGEGATAALEALAWAARIDLERINPGYPETAAWLADDGPVGRRLAGRLAEQPDDLLRGRVRVDLGLAPAWLRRDAILRSLDSPDHGLITHWADLAVRIDDAALESALLRRVADDRILAILIRRLDAMADGALPLPADGVRQHRLMTTIGDDPRTGFRAHRAVRVLRERLAPLAQGPADRYLARSGG
jgi:hypothetical protein